jgi:hypothetical protein
VATLRLERGGKKASLINKFKVLVDDQQVGELTKWGNSGEYEVNSGLHVVTVKAFGGVRGSAQIEFVDGEVVDLVCGYPTFVGGMLDGMSGQDALGFWVREG